MTADSKVERWEVPDASTAGSVGDPDVYSIDVPDGEVWYVEEMGYEATETHGNVGASDIQLAIIGTDDPNTYPQLDGFPRGWGNANPGNYGASLTVGGYAYPGDTIYVGIDETDNPGAAYVLIRRVL